MSLLAVNISDEMLYKALEKVNDLRISAVENFPGDNHVFSARFENKMRKLIKSESRAIYPFINTVGKRVAIIILAILIFSLTTIMSVPALRTGLFEMIEDIYEKYSNISFRNISDSSVELGSFVEYELSNVPKSFTLIESFINDENHRKTQIYSDGENQINYKQSLLHGSKFMLNTENAELLNELMNGVEMYYLKQEDFELIFWHDDTYLFIVSVSEGRDLLLDVVLGVKKK